MSAVTELVQSLRDRQTCAVAYDHGDEDCAVCGWKPSVGMPPMDPVAVRLTAHHGTVYEGEITELLSLPCSCVVVRWTGVQPGLDAANTICLDQVRDVSLSPLPAPVRGSEAQG